MGAWTGLFLATQRGIENGAYYHPVGVRKAGSQFASDQGETDRLWEWTERELGSYNGESGWPEA